MTTIRLTAERVAEIIANKDCFGCIHYTGQFSTGHAGGYETSGYCERDPHHKFFVEADHGCKKFAYVSEEVPATLAEALAEIEDRLDSYSDNDCDHETTVIDELEEHYGVAEAALRHHFGYHPALDYTIHIVADYWLAHRGAGWGHAYGPTPDEYDGTVYVTVCDNNGKTVCDEGGTYEDYRGGIAARAIIKRLSKVAA